MSRNRRAHNQPTLERLPRAQWLEANINHRSIETRLHARLDACCKSSPIHGGKRLEVTAEMARRSWFSAKCDMQSVVVSWRPLV